MSLLFDTPLIAGLDYREEFITAAEESALIEQLSALDLSPFRFHGWLGNRKTQSFGWRYDFDDFQLHVRPIRFPLGCSRCAIRQPNSRGSSQSISSMPCSPVMIPAPASAGTVTATCSTRSSEYR